ncbi:MAG: antibiotic biosynthesis monooxygenase [Dehalococcoidia bacterium]|jgi:hypothetical protein|nr:antibiotic biosynthesis monooxygenase [Dehalococcoidia bacterium]
MTVRDPVTVTISEIVKPDRVQEFEEWLKGLNRVLREADGFIGVDVIRPREHAHPEYVTIIKFTDYDRLKRWQESPVRNEWVAKVSDLTVDDPEIQQTTGFEVWFTRPGGAGVTPPTPAYYKMVLLGIAAVYPLILASVFGLGPLLDSLPFVIELLISVTIISALLTYPVMPVLTRVLSFWLYPSSKRQRE